MLSKPQQWGIRILAGYVSEVSALRRVASIPLNGAIQQANIKNMSGRRSGCPYLDELIMVASLNLRQGQKNSHRFKVAAR